MKYKHKNTGWIATDKSVDGFFYTLIDVEGNLFDDRIHKRLIENCSDWELIKETEVIEGNLKIISYGSAGTQIYLKESIPGNALLIKNPTPEQTEVIKAVVSGNQKEVFVSNNFLNSLKENIKDTRFYDYESGETFKHKIIITIPKEVSNDK